MNAFIFVHFDHPISHWWSGFHFSFAFIISLILKACSAWPSISCNWWRIKISKYSLHQCNSCPSFKIFTMHPALLTWQINSLKMTHSLKTSKQVFRFVDLRLEWIIREDLKITKEGGRPTPNIFSLLVFSAVVMLHLVLFRGCWLWLVATPEGPAPSPSRGADVGVLLGVEVVAVHGVEPGLPLEARQPRPPFTPTPGRWGRGRSAEGGEEGRGHEGRPRIEAVTT